MKNYFSCPLLKQFEKLFRQTAKNAVIAFAALILMLAASGTAQAANHYIRAGAPVGGGGSSWANAWPTFTAITWTRGDTYYVAGGNYSQPVASGTVSDDGTTVALIDRDTNFAAAGVTPNASYGTIVGNTHKQTATRVASITTTYNTNDTLNFTSALKEPNMAGDGYALYNEARIPSLSGTGWIIVKKANESDNGNDPGWDASYAATQAVITKLYIQSGYVKIDGVTGSGTTGHGIKIKCPIDYIPVQISNTVTGPYELLHLDIEGPGFDYGRTGQDGIYHNSPSSSTKGIHISNCWIHEIPKNGITLGAAVGTSYEDYGLLYENNVLERTGGYGIRYPLFHGQGMQFYLTPLSYSIFRNNIFHNIAGQACISLLGGVTTDHIRIYNNVFYSDNGDCTVYGIADSGSNISITQLYRMFSSYEQLTGRVLTNITKGATGVIASVSSGVGTPINISAGMSGGAINEPGDVFSFPTACRSAYLLAATIYSSAGNQITYAEVYNNTFYNLHLAQIAYVTPSNMTGSVAKNNLWANAWFTTLNFTPPLSSTGYYNCADGGYDPVSTESSDPFINSAEYDFHLKSTANARNTAEDLPYIFTTDKDGVTRSDWDIGAYEYASIEPIPGDLSSDGAVTAYDAALALQLGRGELEAAGIGQQAVGL